MTGQFRVVAGRCRTEYEDGTGTTVARGDVLVVCKPDNTVLVHDADGYQPVAWLTRPAAVTVAGDRVEATDGDRRLRVEILDPVEQGRYPASEAGRPVADCPACDGVLVHTGPAVRCGDCGDSYGVPADATVGEGTCDDCGRPTMTVSRGRELRVCLDRSCDPLVDRVRAAFDREWDCPDCGTALRVLKRGGLLLGCDDYPDCEASFSFPAGEVVDHCDCGLPVFETATGTRCLDSGCGTA